MQYQCFYCYIAICVRLKTWNPMAKILRVGLCQVLRPTVNEKDTKNVSYLKIEIYHFVNEKNCNLPAAIPRPICMALFA